MKTGKSIRIGEGLWRRARSAFAFTPMEKRAFGIADDIYGAGLLFAYLAFIQATSDIPVNITSSSGVKVVNGVEKDLNIVKESTIHCDAVNLHNRDAIDLTL
ncbi:hypothetical protein Tco_1208887 [Tanacetum coccineum]